MKRKRGLKKKFYVTTSIAYTNAPPHIGFALELVQADVLARYHRISGDGVFFLTGTDEHGLKNAQAAEKIGKTPLEFTSEISSQYKKLTKILGLSNDDFIRTTDKKRHWPTAQKVWLELKKNGDIYKRQYQGLYCIGHEAFITKKDLLDGKCILHGQEPQKIEEENYFFRLSKYSKQIEKVIRGNQIKIIPEARKNEMLGFISNGLEDVSFSRPRKDLKWGIPVPDDKDHTIYVWSDALSNYISAIGFIGDSRRFRKFWPVDVHCVGKDILKFHALIWPGMLLSLGLVLPKAIFVHGFITVDGQKMSKSLGNVVDPFTLIEKYGADAVRYFLLREIPPTKDGDFTYEKFEARYNSDLAKGLGNLIARVITLADKHKIQNTKYLPAGRHGKITNKNSKFIQRTRQAYKKAIEDFKFNEALAAVWDLISFCDKYIDQEKPWQESKKQKLVIRDLLFAISEIATLLHPFLPETSEKIIGQLKSKKSQPLFPRI